MSRESLEIVKVANSLVAYMQEDVTVKQNVLSSLCDCNERYIRYAIKYINKRFEEGVVDYMIIGTNGGNVLTRNEVKIREYNINKKHHALSELRASYRTNKQLERNKNMTFEQYLKELDADIKEEESL